MRWALLLLLLLSGAARAETRWALVIGNDRGLSHEVDLAYAEADAKKMHALLRELGGVAPENATLLLGEDAATARRTLVSLNDRIRQSNPAQATLIVYYSGHADEAALHMGETSFELSELEALVRGSSAALRLVVLDACRSGALTRVKGGVVGAPVPIERVVERAPVDGVVFLTASAKNEDAQESDRIKGSFFTHYLVSGLRGAADADGDGDVDLDEAYRYAYERTLKASSGTAAGVQHPTFRHEVRGKAEIVLTRVAPSTGMALLELPPKVTWFVFAGSLDGAMLAEVQADAPRRVLALKAQRLFLRGRGKDTLMEATVVVTPGQRLDVAKVPMTRSEYARLVRKGGEAEAVNALEAGYRVTTGLAPATMMGGWVGWLHEREALSLTLRLGLTAGSMESNAPELSRPLSTDALHLELACGMRRAFDVGPKVSLELGGDLGVAWLHQSFDWVGDAPDRNSAAFRLGAAAALVIDLFDAVYLRLEGGAVLWLFESEDGDRNRSVAPALTPRAELGLGWHF